MALLLFPSLDPTLNPTHNLSHALKPDSTFSVAPNIDTTPAFSLASTLDPDTAHYSSIIFTLAPTLSATLAYTSYFIPIWLPIPIPNTRMARPLPLPQVK